MATDHFDLFMRNFPHGGDLSVKVLKGHLIVESIVREIFEMQLLYPDALRGDNGTQLQFHQVICVCQAMQKEAIAKSWAWSAAKKLNAIRNSLAHQLQPKDIEKKINSFIHGVKENTHPWGIAGLDKEPDHELVFALMSLAANFSALKKVLDEANAIAASAVLRT